MKKVLIIILSLSFFFSCEIKGVSSHSKEESKTLTYILKSDNNAFHAIKYCGYTLIDSISYNDEHYFLIGCPQSQSISFILEKLNDFCKVDWIELEQKRNLFDENSGFEFPTYFNSYQSFYDVSHLRETITKFGFGTYLPTVVIIDTGLNLKHIEFSDPQFFSGYSCYRRSEDGTTTLINSLETITLDGEAYNGVSSFEKMSNETNWDGNPKEGHGSHVAGIVAGYKKMLGSCGGHCNVIGYKTFANDKTGKGLSSSGGNYSVYSALLHYLSQKTDGKTAVVNMSFGALSPSKFEAEVLSIAVKNNLLLVAATGNQSKLECEFPATFNYVMAVTAANWDGSVTSFSSRNPTASVSAVGKNVFSVKGSSNDEYCYMEGTSMATPFVAGCAAYLLSLAPTLTVGELRTIIEDGAQDKGEMGHDSQYGYGLVDLLNSAKMAVEHQKYIDSAGVSGSAIKSRYSSLPVSVFVYKEVLVSGVAEKVPLVGNIIYLYKIDKSDSSKFNFYSVGVVQNDGFCSFPLLEEGSYRFALQNSYLEFDFDFSAPLTNLELQVAP